MSQELKIPRVNSDVLMDLRQRKENSDIGRGGRDEIVKVEKIGK
jgi:hypothetical protein